MSQNHLDFDEDLSSRMSQALNRSLVHIVRYDQDNVLYEHEEVALLLHAETNEVLVGLTDAVHELIREIRKDRREEHG